MRRSPAGSVFLDAPHHIPADPTSAITHSCGNRFNRHNAKSSSHGSARLARIPSTGIDLHPNVEAAESSEHRQQESYNGLIAMPTDQTTQSAASNRRAVETPTADPPSTQQPSTQQPTTQQPTTPGVSTDQVIDRIDETLDLIADATSAALGVRPIDHFDLSVIVPVYNERETLPKVLARIEEVMPSACQVVVVDDGSTDGTAEWLRGKQPQQNTKVICRRGNHGKGSAVRLGIRHSLGSVVAIQDADLEYDPADLLRAIWPILDGNADVVYGSRYLDGGSDPSLVHRAGNFLLTRLSNTATGLRLTDMETCHKAFDGDLIRSHQLARMSLRLRTRSHRQNRGHRCQDSGGTDRISLPELRGGQEDWLARRLCRHRLYLEVSEGKVER